MIGAGNVGASAAFRIAQLELADVALIDIVEGIPEGKALDLAQMCPITGSRRKSRRFNQLRRHGELRRGDNHLRDSEKARDEP